MIKNDFLKLHCHTFKTFPKINKDVVLVGRGPSSFSVKFNPHKVMFFYLNRFPAYWIEKYYGAVDYENHICCIHPSHIEIVLRERVDPALYQNIKFLTFEFPEVFGMQNYSYGNSLSFFLSFLNLAVRNSKIYIIGTDFLPEPGKPIRNFQPEMEGVRKIQKYFTESTGNRLINLSWNQNLAIPQALQRDLVADRNIVNVQDITRYLVEPLC